MVRRTKIPRDNIARTRCARSSAVHRSSALGNDTVSIIKLLVCSVRIISLAPSQESEHANRRPGFGTPASPQHLRFLLLKCYLHESFYLACGLCALQLLPLLGNVISIGGNTVSGSSNGVYVYTGGNGVNSYRGGEVMLCQLEAILPVVLVTPLQVVAITSMPGDLAVAVLTGGN